MRLDAGKLRQEIRMEERAPELAVGDAAKPQVFLVADDLADRLVLDATQPGGVDAAGRAVLARLQERRRAEQAADMVGTERR
jgi:hypothetical protein